MPVDNWAPIIKTNMEAVLAAALAAKEIPTLGEVYGYNEWPGNIQVYPATLIGTLGGTQDYSIAGPRIAHHNVRIWVFVGKAISLAETQAMAWPFVERVRDRFAINLQLTTTANHFIPPPPPALFYEVGITEYAGVPQSGIIFNYDLKETENFAVSA